MPAYYEEKFIKGGIAFVIAATSLEPLGTLVNAKLN
jgi:hypothetical protein